MMQELLAIIARGLVDEPDAVVVDRDEPAEDGTVVYHIHVAEDDMGRISPAARLSEPTKKSWLKLTDDL